MARQLIVILAVSVVVGAGGAFAGPYDVTGRCPALLGANVYRCTVKGDDGSSFTDCFRFTTPGHLSPKFEFTSDQLGGSAAGCTCNPGGGVAKPRFNTAASFTCPSSEGVTFAGSVSKNGKIARGSAVNLRGGSYVFNCQPVGACTIQ